MHVQRRGFTLIELIIYLAIVSILLVSISYLVLDILGGQTKSYANQDITQNLRFVTNQLVNDIKSAEDIGSLTSNSLILIMPGDDVTYVFNNSELILTRQLGSDPAVVMHSDRIEVTGSFENLSYGTRSKNVGVTVELAYKNPQNFSDFNASTTSMFAVELRGRK